MAQYRGTLQGNRGDASRLGSKASGLRAVANGWDIGGSVVAYYDEEAKEDRVSFAITGGSNHPGDTVYLKDYRLNGNGEFEEVL